MDHAAIRALLDKQDWADIHARVLDFATARCGKHAKAQAKDLTQEAIARVHAFDSKWDPAKEPDLARYLMSVVNSLRANDLTSYASQNTTSMHTKRGQKAVAPVADDQAWNESRAASDDLFHRRMTLLRERKVDDADVLTLLDLLEQGVASCDDVGRATGWSKTRFETTRKRMLRAAALVARDLGGDDDVEPALDAEPECTQSHFPPADDGDDDEEEVA
jgi:DNA-directed RNA polymerase specialized sigma24 family protein